jgi:hypothetical protein
LKFYYNRKITILFVIGNGYKSMNLENYTN